MQQEAVAFVGHLKVCVFLQILSLKKNQSSV